MVYTRNIITLFRGGVSGSRRICVALSTHCFVTNYDITTLSLPFLRSCHIHIRMYVCMYVCE